MVTFLQLLVSGIGMGCIYCMVAIEYTLIWNASGLVNFGHEKFIMLGAYIFAGTLMLKLGVPSGAAILITILIMFLFGALTAVGVFNPLSRLNSNIFAVMGTLMLSEVLNEAARLIWGPAPFNLPDFIKGSYNVGGVSIPKVYAVIVVVSMLLLVSIHLMFKMTKVGRAMRCVAQDKKAAALMGINVNANIMLTVGLSAAICCIIGILIIPILNVKLTMASVIALKGFSAGIVGGFGSIPGAIVGGLLIGIVESLYTGVGPSVYRDVVAFVLLIGFLLVKPEGILKKKTVNR
ncbi:MAG: branched-chain amino acid ABC transporter permease [Firmicutes bacterium]|nr:branched-chain amino acid ABC transporter permease [Bacillota bacterium]